MISNPFPEAHVLVVDDELSTVGALRRLLDEWGYLNGADTSNPADVASLCLRQPPDLVIMDLHMPGLDGFQVLELLRPWTTANPPVPVLVVTSDVSSEVRERALANGARDFLTKPFQNRELRLRVGNLLEMRKAHLELQLQNETLEQRISERTQDVDQAKVDALDRLALAGEYRDDSTQEHAQRVGRTAAMVAEQMGVSSRSVEIVRRAATLHDIGKIGIPDAILLKPDKLTDDEFEVIRTHARIGYDILIGSTSELLRVSAQIALSHHERWDAKGYPSGLAAEQAPLVGRLVAVSDVFDALTHDRPYKQAWAVDDAVAEILRGGGTQFDPRVVQAFSELDHDLLMAPVSEDRVATPTPDPEPQEHPGSNGALVAAGGARAAV
jgi:putative two-component system response regulator